MRIGQIFVVWVAAALAACGGGGGGGTSESGGSNAGGPDNAVTVSGYVLKGPVAGAIVRLQTVAPNGARADLAQTTSSQDGSYQFRTAPAAGSVLLVTAGGGSYTDEATGTTRTITSSMRAVDVWDGAPKRIVLTAFSEAGVRLVEQPGGADWSAPTVRAANAKVDAWLGVAGFLNFQPIDLRASTIPATATPLDTTMSLLAGTVSTFARRLDANPATSLDSALAGVYRLAFIDPLDDRLAPAFLGALIDFIDLTGLPADSKRALKGSLLTDSNPPPVDAVLQRYVPSGIASGQATASMPDDGFQLLGYPGGRTVFNLRGALVGYTTSADTSDWQVAYTASVAELFGDGEVGIGRWNGGAIISTVRKGSDFVPSPILLPYDALHYAVAKSATSVPACGLRRLSLVASTQPTLQSESVGEVLMISGLAPDSTLGVQYLRDTYVGADIGLRMPDGTVVRFRTVGGSASPWAGGAVADGSEHFLEQVGAPGALQGQRLSISALVGGDGARKAVLRLRLRKTSDPTEMTAVFVAPDAPPDLTGCASAGAAGPGISPLPSDGQRYVFATFASDPLSLGAPVDVTFGTGGQLTAVRSPLTLASPVYDLAGTAGASVGRVQASGALGAGPSVSRSMPYAVVDASGTVPASGTVVYDLVHATGVIADRGGLQAQVPVGRVETATLEIVYGQFPLGTPSAYYGTARLRVNGSIDGLPFFLAADPADPSSGPAEAQVFGPTFSSTRFSGGVGAPSGEYAALSYSASVNGTPLNGALLFRRRP